MAEIRTVTTLKSKRHQIEAAISGYEMALNQARADLAHINAAIAIFEAPGEPGEIALTWTFTACSSAGKSSTSAKQLWRRKARWIRENWRSLSWLRRA
ncbi:MAG: hypothetical protein CMI59_15150 [Parvibaculum sp.]|nr:hypothetical protein [Parvibaculum sp.]|tara:strand:+ start:155 stop:448 length:294 start_codon:yes stop_codon:yes gene_type:complete